MAKRKFSMLAPEIWTSKRFRAQTERSKLLALYLIAGPHQTNLGCYWLSEGYVCSDMGWTPDELEAARTPLIEAGLIAFDPETDEVFVPGWFKFCGPKNDDHAVAVDKQLADIDSKPLREQARKEFEEYESKRPRNRPRLSAIQGGYR